MSYNKLGIRLIEKESYFDTFEDKEFNTITEYDLERKIKSKLLYIENRNTSMIFWMSGFDDLEGIMFMKSGWTDEVWEGLVRIKRIQGNSYKVYTY
ncbi:hypothetical protein SAMN06296386_112117 [Lachnospiraceae bacterium]|nr:hypothetical protein SAMN06296386_112117 [Lachnospiraceae bacterium]